MKLIYSKRAISDLRSIVSYIAEDNVDVAIKVGNQIESAVERLSQFPLMGKMGRVVGTGEWVPVYPYVIVYTVEPEKVQITAILHGKLDYK